jgi:hypothetical protein
MPLHTGPSLNSFVAMRRNYSKSTGPSLRIAVLIKLTYLDMAGNMCRIIGLTMRNHGLEPENATL